MLVLNRTVHCPRPSLSDLMPAGQAVTTSLRVASIIGFGPLFDGVKLYISREWLEVKETNKLSIKC